MKLLEYNKNNRINIHHERHTLGYNNLTNSNPILYYTLLISNKYETS